MTQWRNLTTMMLAIAFTVGCAARSEPVDDSSISGTPSLAPIEGVQTVSEDTLQALEMKCACKLPDDYRSFLLQNNGAFPSPDRVAFTEADHETSSDVFCFFAIDDERAWASMLWHYETYNRRIPKDTLPIARDSCGNLWLLSLNGETSGSVYFWDHGSYDTFDETDLGNWPCVATSFKDFRDRMNRFGESNTDGPVVSRYALAKQAADGMLKNNAGFSTRANPGIVWHCSCSDDGDVTMEFVKYDLHAAATHTDGYSRLRALKGLIEEGQTRLPE